MKSGSVLVGEEDELGLSRRDFLKVGAGFSAMLSIGGALGGCGDAVKSPATGFAFLQAGDVELFSALAPAVVVDLARFDAPKRKALVVETLRNIDATCTALGQASQEELRKLLNLLAMTPLRYALTGIGGWSEAGVDQLHAFLARWRGSRFATLNAGGNVLIKLVASSYYVLPASWPGTGYPGPLDYAFKALNS